MNQDAMRPEPVQRRKSSVLRTVKAVAWSFIGRAQGQRDTRKTSEKVNPLHVIGVGLAGGVLRWWSV